MKQTFSVTFDLLAAQLLQELAIQTGTPPEQLLHSFIAGHFDLGGVTVAVLNPAVVAAQQFDRQYEGADARPYFHEEAPVPQRMELA